ncbi:MULTISPECIES: ribosome small subunit-dependent GTPase A [unclassified Paraburkholderia]|uniref:ribosome small subunit-dependent GTPase A n=1 Tax=unclassified Paraburkholderia TaxID=2615204 RepID=UPI00160F5004|nr:MULTISPECIES: ribosome small subunit-dependent GTPase A [unclassified Paraburkholderia]MBB5443294.1 ribosome biogenesis GTPase [Paraburkholderia sp. WSM4177]MBB5484485.1 ribosome biogenesis GTPase [Paraburkholderia sp. WSM4180]
MSGRAPKKVSRGASAIASGMYGVRTGGLVVAAHGRHYLVAPEDGGALLQCFPRGKRSEVAVGDRVIYEPTSADQGVIVEIGERRNLLYRSDQYKSKLFAANLDQLLIVLATEPHFSEDLLGRALVAAEANELKPLIVLNKIDVTDALDGARKRLEPYRALGYPVLEASIRMQPEAARATLTEHLHGHATLLLGQSGMGKSTLVNLLIPDAEVATREISTALNSGRHTTTFTRLYPLPQSEGTTGVNGVNGAAGALIDSPGFQEFGLHHLSEGRLERAFPEFRPLLPNCRFYNCHHLHEPGCAILEAVADGRIRRERHALYAQLVHEASQIVR